jgi:hypothetical protein
MQICVSGASGAVLGRVVLEQGNTIFERYPGPVALAETRKKVRKPGKDEACIGARVNNARAHLPG